MKTDTLPPHDEPAEWNLLACAVLKPSIIPAIDPFLFYTNGARSVLKSVQMAFDGQLPCTESPELFEHWLSKDLDSDQYEAISKALATVPGATSWLYWADVLADCYKARQLEQLKPRISEISAKVAKGHSPDEILHEISDIARSWQPKRLESIGAIMPRVLESIDFAIAHGRMPGPRTGFTTFDRITGGLQEGRLHIIAGRPGQGKSSYAMALAMGAARNGTSVGFFSLEMTKEEIANRMLAYESRVPIIRQTARNQSDEELALMRDASIRIRQLSIGFEDKITGLSAIIMAAHQSVAEGAGLLVIDYLQKITIPKFRQNRNELVTEISGTMKHIAMMLRVPVICCAQLNREPEKQNREPNMADLRDSGSLEQDADLIGILHATTASRSDLVLVKNRNGDRGKIALEFRRELFRFDEL